MTKPEEIISAFDECREYIFGYGLGRDNPHKTDLATAQQWLDDGLTLVVAVMVFTEQMNWMHEKFLKYGEAKDRKYLPNSLSIFNENIEMAIRRSKGTEIDETEKHYSLWRSRYKAYLKNRSWLEMWGPRPGEMNCRVPISVIQVK